MQQTQVLVLEVDYVESQHLTYNVQIKINTIASDFDDDGEHNES